MLSPREINWLLEDLCVRGGYCTASHEFERLCAETPPTAEAFAQFVVAAEGLDPFYDAKLYRDVLSTVERAYERARLRTVS